MEKKLLVLGGDMRIVKMADSFASSGMDVSVFGFNVDTPFNVRVKRCQTLEEGIKYADIIITGLPITTDNATVNSPLYDGEIYFYEVFKCMTKEQILIGGKIPENIFKLGKVYSIKVIDYFTREELTVLNSIPTAEGAIEIAMREMPVTLHSSKCLVLGFGRIGKILSHMLSAIGASVYAEARKYADLAWIKAYGYNAIRLDELKTAVIDKDVIFNTIPYEILSYDLLAEIDKSTLIIDLASTPGGVNTKMAEILGLKVITALSLPGKVAPETAGEMIKVTIENIFSELGV